MACPSWSGPAIIWPRVRRPAGEKRPLHGRGSTAWNSPRWIGFAGTTRNDCSGRSASSSSESAKTVSGKPGSLKALVVSDDTSKVASLMTRTAIRSSNYVGTASELRNR